MTKKCRPNSYKQLLSAVAMGDVADRKDEMQIGRGNDKRAKRLCAWILHWLPNRRF